MITCPLLEAPENGTVTYSVDTETEGIGFGAMATYSCNHESLGVSGDRVRECKPGSHGNWFGYELVGIWSEKSPSCECKNKCKCNVCVCVYVCDFLICPPTIDG